MRHKRSVGSGSELTLSEGDALSRNARLICARCGGPIPPGARRDARYCSSPCRQAAYRRRATGQPAGELVALPRQLSTVAPAYAAPSTRAHARRVAARIEPVSIAAADHDHSSRLCAVCMTRRHESIRRARHGRVSAEIVAQRIRRDRGVVWGAVHRVRDQLFARARDPGRLARRAPHGARGPLLDSRLDERPKARRRARRRAMSAPVRSPDELTEAIAMLRDVLDHDRWRNGDPLASGDRDVLRYHLELLRADRDAHRRAIAVAELGAGGSDERSARAPRARARRDRR